MYKALFVFGLCLLFSKSGITQITAQHKTTCNPIWEYVDWGRDIGEYNNLFPYDDGNDGTIEFITNSRYLGADNTYSWSVIKFDPERKTYEQVYTSERYINEIKRMLIQDIDQDSIPELLLVEGNNLHIIEIDNRSTISTVSLTGVYNPFYANQIRFGDADNDGQNEILVGGHDKLNFVNPLTFQVKRVLNVNAGEFDLGNVDNDTATELAFYTGIVLEINGPNVVTEYELPPGSSSPQGFLLLEDIDNDQRDEMIVTLPWDSLKVYDVETQKLKYGKFTDGAIGALSILDIEDDGMKEILYSINQWGDMYCLRASNGSQRWKIANQGWGTMACTIADVDQDQVKEIIWTTLEDDHGSIHIWNSSTRLQEWDNTDLNAPFFAISLADIDNDLEPEIVAIGSTHHDITIFDAITKKIEYQSSSGLLPEDFHDVNSLLIDDYKDDGDQDIIIGGDVGYDGAIYILDGDTRVTEASHIFTDMDRIDDLKLTDLDHNGSREFVALTRYKVYVINSVTFQIIWSYDITGFPLDQNRNLLIDNLDHDPALEIIVCNGSIYSFDDSTFEKKQSSSDKYLSAITYDWNKDGKRDVIASTESGEIHILETENLNVIQTLKFGEDPIVILDTIDLNEDEEIEFVASAAGHVLFFNRSGKYTESQYFTEPLGLHDGRVIKDYDGDGIPDVLICTERGIMQLNTACAACLLFDPMINYTDPHCNVDNGEIFLTSVDTSAVYSLEQEILTPPFQNLSSGYFDVLAQNQDGCQVVATIRLEDHDLNVNLHSVNRTCSGTDDGIAFLNVTEATQPYTVLWSTGAITDTIMNLTKKKYRVTVIDSLGCVYMDSINVGQDTVILFSSVVKAACLGTNNGQAQGNAQYGHPPYSFIWDGIPGTERNDSLIAGSHTLMVLDAHGCSTSKPIEIPETYVEITTEMLTPACNGLNTGSVKANVITGNFPYTYTWSNMDHSPQVNNLYAGTYSVIVKDTKKCLAYDTIAVTESMIEANLIIDSLICHEDRNGTALVNVTQGVPPFLYVWSNGEVGSQIDSLQAGSYSSTVTDSVGCTIIQDFEIEASNPIVIYLSVLNDVDVTTEYDGSIHATISGGAPPYQFHWSTGASESFIDSLSQGSYTLKVIDANGCESDTVIMLQLSTGINNPKDEYILIYPNPVSNHLYVTTQNGSNQIYEITLYSMDGMILRNEKWLYPTDKIKLDVGSIAPGVYLLYVKSKNAQLIKKCVAVIR